MAETIILPITRDDYKIVETLSRGIERALAFENYAIARKYIETGSILLDPTPIKTRTDNDMPTYDQDKVKEIQDKIWSILDALDSRPELTAYLEAPLIILRQQLFEQFLKGAIS